MDFQPSSWYVLNNFTRLFKNNQINCIIYAHLQFAQWRKFINMHESHVLDRGGMSNCWGLNLRRFCDGSVTASVFAGGLDGHQHLSLRLVLPHIQYWEPVFLHASSFRGEYR